MSNVFDSLLEESYRETQINKEEDEGEDGEEAEEGTISALQEARKNLKVSYEDFDFDKLNIYAGIDCLVTSEMLKKQFGIIFLEQPITDVDLDGTESKAKAPAIIEGFSSIVIPAQEFLIDLEINGIDYSVPRNKWISEKMSNHIAQLDDQIFSTIGKKIDLNSGPKVAEFLYGEKGFSVPGYTKGGEPATDGTAILTLAGIDPSSGKYVTEDPSLQWLADMAVRRDVSSAHNTFIKTYVKDFVKRDGKIHPSYNQFGTSSFRITGSDPNLTQLPRARHGYNIRTCFIVELEEVFISFDFSSAEVKVLANISKEPAMLKAIQDGLDFHGFSASAMRGIPYEEFMGVLNDKKHPLFKEYKEYRQLAKILTFSLLYGSSILGIAMQLFLTKEAAQAVVDMYFRVFPRVKNYIETTHRFALLNQMTLTPLGQRKMQFGTYPCFKNTAAYNGSFRNSQNVRIQSTTSSVGLATFAELNERIKPLGGKGRCTVFDSFEFSCPKENAAAAINLAYDVLNTFPLETFPFMELPIGCDGDVGLSWGENEAVHVGVTQVEVEALMAKVRDDSIKSFGSFLYN